MVLDTDDLVYDVIQQVCHNHGGFLPEPRDEAENTFLDSLGTEMFTLGMTDRDVEGQWVWDSDGSLVTWTKWVQYTGSKPSPNGGDVENCALMMRNFNSQADGHTSDSWGDYRCGSTSFWNSKPISLVCQKNPGMWKLYKQDLL